MTHDHMQSGSSWIPTLRLGPEPYTWTFDSIQVLLLVAVALGYALRVRRLRAEGDPVPRGKQALFATGFAVVVLAVISPVEALGHRLFLAHMGQHILLGDVGGILVTLGLSGAILRPVLDLPLLRRIGNPIQPGFAFLCWGANLALWHVPPAFELMHRNAAVGLVEQACFLGFGCWLWASITEPVRAPRWFGTGWKIALVIAVCLVEALIANMLFWIRTAPYSSYEGLPHMLGLTPIEDVNYGGALMMTNGTILGLIVIAVLFYRISVESELEQQLLESGLAAEDARDAVQSGQAAALLARRRPETPVGIADR
jgi:putative membrane protein